jgi:hypothetical protein
MQPSPLPRSFPSQAEGGHSASTILFPEVFATEHPFFEEGREEYEVQQLKNILQFLAFVRSFENGLGPRRC